VDEAPHPFGVIASTFPNGKITCVSYTSWMDGGLLVMEFKEHS
jgi:hypothetical protein